MHYSFPKNERLKSRKTIDKIFGEGRSLTHYPLRLRYVENDASGTPPLQVVVGVPKRNFKKAVSRNRIKRLLREAYRLNKGLVFNNIEGSFALLILYLGKDMPQYGTIEPALKALLKKFLAKHHEKKR